MNYNRLKELLKSNNYSVKSMAEKIGMSEQGLHASIRNDSLTVSNLEKIANALGVPVCSFFEEKTSSFEVGEQAPMYGTRHANFNCEKLIQENEHLKKEIELKDKIINLLEKK